MLLLLFLCCVPNTYFFAVSISIRMEISDISHWVFFLQIFFIHNIGASPLFTVSQFLHRWISNFHLQWVIVEMSARKVFDREENRDDCRYKCLRAMQIVVFMVVYGYQPANTWISLLCEEKFFVCIKANCRHSYTYAHSGAHVDFIQDNRFTHTHICNQTPTLQRLWLRSLIQYNAASLLSFFSRVWLDFRPISIEILTLYLFFGLIQDRCDANAKTKTDK